MSSESWGPIRQELLRNARRVSVDHREEIEKWRPVKAGDGEFIPAYVPYVGHDYFSKGTHGHRIMAYALSQNLRPGDPVAHAWAADWLRGDGELALDRQNAAYKASGKAVMHPFDTGHIPILASLLRSVVTGRDAEREQSIYPQIAATNLSKFSFRSDADRAVDHDGALRRCWDWVSELEVRLLRPDYIICCGQRVYNVVRSRIDRSWSASEARPLVLQVSFPGLLVINSRYRKELRPQHSSIGQLVGLTAASDLGRRVDHDLTIRAVLERDTYYFAEMLRRMDEQVRRQRKGRDG